jgi:FkbM family methyltransferase
MMDNLKNKAKKNPLLRRAVLRTRLLYHKIFTHDSFGININKFFLADGDETYLLNYNLNPDSVVFEVGGYLGIYAGKVAEKFNPNLYIFEPVASYYRVLQKKFSQNPKVRLFDFGLSGANFKVSISIENDASSVYRAAGSKEVIQLNDVYEFCQKENIKRIDLMSVNIEGGEYDLLARIIESGLLKNIGILQVQFHNFVPQAKEKRSALIAAITKTHKPLFSFPFVWEAFKKIGD